MIINKHILKLENVYYVNNKFYVPESPHNNEYKKFIHNYEINNDFRVIKQNSYNYNLMLSDTLIDNITYVNKNYIDIDYYGNEPRLGRHS